MPYSLDDPPEGWPPSNWEMLDEFAANTHCCDWQWWLNLFGGDATMAGYARWLTCKVQWGIICPGEGGEPQ